jgi:hypothetical protein
MRERLGREDVRRWVALLVGAVLALFALGTSPAAAHEGRHVVAKSTASVDAGAATEAPCDGCNHCTHDHCGSTCASSVCCPTIAPLAMSYSFERRPTAVYTWLTDAVLDRSTVDPPSRPPNPSALI